jgi:hypothetical protein
MTLSERRQLLVAGVQGVVAVLALGISTWTFVQQVDLNADQQILNDYARERDERKYSSRVAIWAVASTSTNSYLPAGLNRSPVPLRHVAVFAGLTSGRIGEAPLPDIPPCTIERHRVAPPAGDGLLRSADRPTQPSGPWLRFSVDDRYWKLTSDQLDEAEDRSDAGDVRLRRYPIDDEEAGTGPVEDCGEGG